MTTEPMAKLGSLSAWQAAAEHAAKASELLAASPDCRCRDTENCPYEDMQRSIAQLAQAHAAAGQLYAALASAGSASGPAAGFTGAMLDRLIAAAGELWDSTGGDDPHDVLSAAQREALDSAAAAYRAALSREMGTSGNLPGCDGEAAR